MQPVEVTIMVKHPYSTRPCTVRFKLPEDMYKHAKNIPYMTAIAQTILGAFAKAFIGAQRSV